MKFISFEEYYKKYPYKHTKTFTEAEWIDHIYSIWKQKMKEIEPERFKEYVVVLESGKSILAQAFNYMNAKYVAVKKHGAKLTEIAYVL